MVKGFLLNYLAKIRELNTSMIRFLICTWIRFGLMNKKVNTLVSVLAMDQKQIKMIQ